MELPIGQLKAVWQRNFRSQLSRESYIGNLLMPFIFGLLDLASHTYQFSWIVFAQFYYYPICLSALFRNGLMNIVSEKKDKLKEMQRIMSLRPFAYSLGLFCSLLCWALIAELFYLLPLQFGTFVDKYLATPYLSDQITIYSFYNFALAGQLFLLSSLFQDEIRACEVYGMLILLQQFLFLLIQSGAIWKFLEKTLTYIFPVTFLMSQLYPKSHLVGLSILEINGVFLLQGVIQFLFYLYFDMVLPNEFGNQLHPLFFLKCFRTRNQTQVMIEEAHELEVTQNTNLHQELMAQNDIEEQAVAQVEDDQALVKAKSIVKLYNGKRVVNQLTLHLQKDQIFCLLGHNGAGKSTTINILTGMVHKNDGQVTICGYDLDSELSKIRQVIGYCTQKDILFLKMTVYDQLEYFAQIKEVPSVHIQDHITNILTRCQLLEYKYQLAANLSGGVKRKLCLAISLVGYSKVIFLDEPTTGVDPGSRQEIWKILREVKVDRCIILTTHHLDEAQELADQVGIISDGQLIVQGTVEQIKRRFSVGYHFSVECKDELHAEQLLPFLQETILQQTSAHIRILKQYKTLRTVIPEYHKPALCRLFNSLERIQDTKVSFEMNTLEDAYVNIHLTLPKPSDQVPQQQSMNFDPSVFPVYSFRSQMASVIVKKLYFFRSNKFMFFKSSLLYLIIMAILVFIILNRNSGFPISSLIGIFTICKLIFQGNTVYLPIYEKQTKAKEALLAMGQRLAPYWLGTLLADLIPVIIETILFFLATIAILSDSLKYPNMAFYIIYLIIFQVALNCFSYFLSVFFSSTRRAYVYIFLLTQLIYYLLYMIITAIYISFSWYTHETAVAFIYSIPHPFMALQYGLIKLNQQGVTASVFTWMLFDALLYFLLTLAFEKRKYRNYFQAPGGHATIQAIGLTKQYDGVSIVSGISFQVNRKQIVGLLGPNGAGKSTTFNMLTRFEAPSSGQILIKDHTTQIGIVPQFSPLYEQFTIRQHFAIYGYMKGMTNQYIEEFTKSFSESMGLGQVLDNETRLLSGGERRKAAVGICLIGGSSQLLLDEPSSGMDPVSRQSLQEILLSNCRQNESSILINTHSMHEAQRICDVIHIMINGKIVCAGTMGELRSLFSNALRLSLQLKEGVDKERVIDLVRAQFKPENTEQLPEIRKRLATFKINCQNSSLAQVFEFCEQRALQELVEDFAIYQTTLDQIFHFFATQQIQYERVDVGQQRRENRGNLCKAILTPCFY